MNGACGFLRRSLRSTFEMLAVPASSSVLIAFASSAVFGSAFSPSNFQMRASNGGGSPARQVTSTDQYSSGLNALISSSRSQTRRTATEDRKSTRLNSSHSQISYAVFCLKKKKKKILSYK